MDTPGREAAFLLPKLRALKSFLILIPKVWVFLDASLMSWRNPRNAGGIFQSGLP